MILFLTIIVSLFCFSAIIASAWSADNPEHIEEYIHYVAGKEGVPIGEALAIARCESRLNKDAHNTKGENSVGIFQINLKYHLLTLEEAKNPFINIGYAIDLYLKEGWLPWKNCAIANGILS